MLLCLMIFLRPTWWDLIRYWLSIARHRSATGRYVCWKWKVAANEEGTKKQAHYAGQGNCTRDGWIAGRIIAHPGECDCSGETREQEKKWDLHNQKKRLKKNCFSPFQILLEMCIDSGHVTEAGLKEADPGSLFVSCMVDFEKWRIVCFHELTLPFYSPKEIREKVCSFIHQLFIADPLLARVVHMQVSLQRHSNNAMLVFHLMNFFFEFFFLVTSTKGIWCYALGHGSVDDSLDAYLLGFCVWVGDPPVVAEAGALFIYLFFSLFIPYTAFLLLRICFNFFPLSPFSKDLRNSIGWSVESSLSAAKNT